MKTKLLFFLVSIFLMACSDSDDDKNQPKKSQKVTYKVTSLPAEVADIIVTYIDSQGNTITDTVESEWFLEVEVPAGHIPVIGALVSVKFEYQGLYQSDDCSCTAQIIQNGKVVKEGTGRSVALSFL